MRPLSASYPLSVIQEAVRKGSYWITSTALEGASKLDLGPDDIVTCVLEITEHDFYKSMPSRQRSGTFQDVYRPTHDGRNLYVKLQLDRRNETVVISFKSDESR